MRTQRAAAPAILLMAVACAATAIAACVAPLLRDVERVQGSGEATLMLAPTMESPLPTPQETAVVTLGRWTYQLQLAAKGLAAGRAPLVDEFLPDSQTLAVLLWKNPGELENQEAVAILDTATGSLTPFGFRHPTFIPSDIVWLESVHQMAFLRSNSEEQLPEFAGYDLVLASLAEPARTTATAVGNAATITGRDTEILVLNRKTGSVILTDANSSSMEVLVDDARKYGLQPESDSLLQMQMHPELPLAILFGESGSILIDTSAKQASVLSLGADQSELYDGSRWALDAAWNPRAAELALIVGVGMPSLPSSRLFLLDVPSGRLIQRAVPVRWITDTAWAPHGEHLLILGVDEPGAGNTLWLMETSTGKLVELDVAIGTGAAGASGWSVAWSPDGQLIAIVQGDAVQLLHVEINESPVKQ